MMKLETPAEQFVRTLSKQIASRQLQTPAIFFLETLAPFGSIFENSLIFAEPFISPFSSSDTIGNLSKFFSDQTLQQKLKDLLEQSQQPV